MKLLFLVLQLGFSFWVWWAKQDADKKQVKQDMKKEVKDAISSGDVSRVHALIEHIGRL